MLFTGIVNSFFWPCSAEDPAIAELYKRLGKYWAPTEGVDDDDNGMVLGQGDDDGYGDGSLVKVDPCTPTSKLAEAASEVAEDEIREALKDCAGQAVVSASPVLCTGISGDFGAMDISPKIESAAPFEAMEKAAPSAMKNAAPSEPMSAAPSKAMENAAPPSQAMENAAPMQRIKNEAPKAIEISDSPVQAKPRLNPKKIQDFDATKTARMNFLK